MYNVKSSSHLHIICPPSPALYCIVIFALTGLSLLETMLVSFLIDMDSRVDHDIQTSSKTCEETPEETDCQRGEISRCFVILIRVFILG